MVSDFTDADLAVLQGAAIPQSEAQSQLERLRRGMVRMQLERPCLVGAGIVRVSGARRDELVRCHDEAATAGRMMKFVPASGAATRMFRDLTAWLNAADDAIPSGIESFVSTLEDMPFYGELSQVLSQSDAVLASRTKAERYRVVLRTLLLSEGLNYLHLPKALVPFHLYSDGVRSAFADHLVEATSLVRNSEGVCRLHFTVGAAHREQFEDAAKTAARALQASVAAQIQIDLSSQAPHTDTIALDEDGQPFRTTDGTLLLRPGGHGALLENLAAAGGDIVLIKNIDNIQRQPAYESSQWIKVLGGLAVSLHARVCEILCDLASASERELDKALTFASDELGVSAPAPEQGASEDAKRAWLRQQLDRPLRVCGVVPNEGHAGGGPFWVRNGDGSRSRQIVESAEVDHDDDAQRALFESSTHFNPVIMACAVRDHNGNAHDLRAFCDVTACFVAEKTFEGRSLTALEHPGLWNGAMSGWNTLFVELPSVTFTPVKSVTDLLSAGHRADLRMSA